MILDLFRREIEFNNKHGYDDTKDIVRRVLDPEDDYNVQFSSKSIKGLATNL